MTALLSIQDLQKNIAGTKLLDIGQLTIDQAQAYVLTGINGAGKSTLLRILCGLESCQMGQAQFMGKTVQWSPHPKTLRDAIVYVHQHPLLKSHRDISNRHRAHAAGICTTNTQTIHHHHHRKFRLAGLPAA